MAARAGHPIGFVAFLRYGLPVTLVSLVLATALRAAEVHMSPRHDQRTRRPRAATAPHRRHRSSTRSGRLLDSELPALPVVDEREPLRRHLRRARVHERALPRLPRPAQGRRRSCAARSTRPSRSATPAAASRSSKYMNTEHVDVGPDFSDTQVAEIFLHHRVLDHSRRRRRARDRRDHPQRLLPPSPSASWTTDHAHAVTMIIIVIVVVQVLDLSKDRRNRSHGG